MRLGEEDSAQEGVKSAFHAATAAVGAEWRGLRRWLIPWRRIVKKALKGRHDLMQRVGVA